MERFLRAATSYTLWLASRPHCILTATSGAAVRARFSLPSSFLEIREPSLPQPGHPYWRAFGIESGDRIRGTVKAVDRSSIYDAWLVEGVSGLNGKTLRPTTCGYAASPR